MTCRCGKDHSNDIPFDENKALDEAAQNLANTIDKEALLRVGKWIDDDKGYELSTPEKQQEFAKKRNDPWDVWKPSKDIA